MKCILQKNKLVIGDCNMGCQIPQYGALLEVMGEKTFDMIFKDGLIIGDYEEVHGGNPLMLFCVKVYNVAHPQIQALQQAYNTSQFSLLDKERFEKLKTDPLVPGARVIFLNDKTYLQKHLIGDSPAYNMIVKEDNAYLGPGFSKEGISGDEVCKSLIEAYNYPPLDPEKVLNDKCYIWYQKQFKQHQSEKYKTAQINKIQIRGYDHLETPLFMYKLNVDLIQEIMSLPLEKRTLEIVKILRKKYL